MISAKILNLSLSAFIAVDNIFEPLRHREAEEGERFFDYPPDPTQVRFIDCNFKNLSFERASFSGRGGAGFENCKFIDVNLEDFESEGGGFKSNSGRVTYLMSDHYRVLLENRRSREGGVAQVLDGSLSELKQE